MTPHFTRSPINIRAFDHLMDDDFVCTDEQRRDRVIITLYGGGLLDWDYVMKEHGGVTMDDMNGVSLTWSLPVNVRAAPLRAFISDHLSVLERVHLGHTVEWDGRNRVGELDDDAQEAFAEFRDALEGSADNLDNIIVPLSGSRWFEGTETDFVGLDDNQLEAVVRESTSAGKPVKGSVFWVVVEALAYAREIRDNAEVLNDE